MPHPSILSEQGGVSNVRYEVYSLSLTSAGQLCRAPSLALLVLLLGEGHLAAVDHLLLSAFSLVGLQGSLLEDNSQLDLDDNFHWTASPFDQCVQIKLLVQRMLLRGAVLLFQRLVELQLSMQISTWPVCNGNKSLRGEKRPAYLMMSFGFMFSLVQLYTS